MDGDWFPGFEARDIELPGIRLHARIGGRADAPPHGLCEDYRASAGIDREDDRESRHAGARVACPMLVLWGARGVVHSHFDALALWRAQCSAMVEGRALDCGHYVPEEQPEETAAALLGFFAPATAG